MTDTKKKRTPKELWEAIEEQATQDDMDRIQALPMAELDAELADAGFDPAKVREDGVAFVERLFAWRERQAWKASAKEKLAKERSRFEALLPRSPSGARLAREELLLRIGRARTDPRLGAGATVMFRNKDLSAATDEELAALLDELLALPEAEE